MTSEQPTPPMPTGSRASARHPERIGPYRILKVLGEGGMGVVYEARQDQPRRLVALKVMHHAAGSRLWAVGSESCEPWAVSSGPAHSAQLTAAQRFAFEAETLGRLHHPAVVPIFEAGSFESDAGPQPYFAMELVHGEPLTTFAERRDLPLRQRVELLIRVCDGVEHAHAHGVVHRDLKPGNVLVDEAGQPHILDFGIARAVAAASTSGADLHAATLHTGMGQLLGTIAYMSPEQVTGDSSRVDARSDVYALGVLATEMLTGQPPYDLRNLALVEAARVIREDDPARLSSLNRTLRGDLDTIIGKALEKDVRRRYQSAAALADDLRRYLDEKPVNARPPSAMYQMRKFAQRHTAVVTGIAGVFAALLLGVIGIAWQLERTVEQRDLAIDAEHRATQRLNQTLDAVWTILLAIDESLPNIRGSTAVRQELADGAVRQLAALPLEGGVPRVLGYAHQRRGEVQSVMGRSAAALASFTESLAIRELELDRSPD
ncbi:MAG: serine/threonine protein kinase, partial [Burkholderiales bacterium]